MKKTGCWLALFGIALIVTPGLGAQNRHGMGFNGITGLYSIPSGYIGRNDVDLGIDLGMTYNFVNRDPIVKAGFSLFKWVELTAAFDFQPKVNYPLDDKQNNSLNNTDIITGIKVQLPADKTAIALGGNLQIINRYVDRSGAELAGQLYIAVSYPAEFFGMPVETSLSLGYTFRKPLDSNIDFGMGFDLTLLPDVFKEFIHWLVDFSNFSYSIDPLGNNAWYRGALNTGLRIDLAAIPALNKFKFFIDVIAADILDDGNRSFIIGTVFGLPLK
ncbi:MAG: hypothetical protein LBD78_05815 [Spirochaetaceae bacterium]|jgi:hypothetical protein|nr:hypothetical protein [Spirochaetaceae bacterium]